VLSGVTLVVGLPTAARSTIYVNLYVLGGGRVREGE
jgi:hypothetical protein